MRLFMWAAAAILLLMPAVTQAQTRVRVVVEYMTETQLYLSAGQLQGLFANDTLTAYRDASTRDSVRFAIVTSSRTRAVGVALGPKAAIARGDVFYVSVSAVALLRAEQLRTPRVVVADTAAPATASGGQRAARRPGARTSGRLGLELDATRTEIRYGAGESQTTDRTYFTPSMRLRVRTEQLPGGLRFSANLRATHFSAYGSQASETRVQLYQASVEGDIDPAAIHFQVGRFYNSYESHSGFWDGLLIRLGSSRMGAGVVAGYTPARGDQTLSSASPKVSAFVDAHARSGKLRYDVDISAHQQSNVFLIAEREFLGVSQNIAYGRAYFTQRVQFGKTAGKMELWQAQFSGNVPVAGPLSVNARYTTERNDLYFAGASDPGHRTRMSAGAVVSGRAGFANLEAGTLDSGFGTEARIASLNFFLPRSLLIASLGFSGSITRDGATTSTYLAPYVERNSGRIRARLGGSYFRTDFGTSVFEQKGADLSLNLPVGSRSEVGWTAAAATGSGVRSVRTTLTFWQGF